MSNKIYEDYLAAQPQFKSIQSYDRVDIDDNSIGDLNVYRWWGEFGLKPEPRTIVSTRKDEHGNIEYYIPAHKGKGGKSIEEKIIDKNKLFYTDKEHPRIGTISLFNNSYAISSDAAYQIHNNAPLIDDQETRKTLMDLGDCSIKALVQATREGKMGLSSYDYSDFMFCKHLGRVSNNYMVTLRRFPNPAGDHINLTMHGEDGGLESQVQKHLPDIGRMITWIGTPGNSMENILKYNVLMPYKELQSSIEQVSGGGETGGIMGSILNITNASYAGMVMGGTAGSSSIPYLQSVTNFLGRRSPTIGKLGNLMSGPPGAEGSFGAYDKNKNYGPVDVIAKTHMRAGGEDGGLEFNQEISLVFDYELRSYDGINTRAAFLDLIANILAVTYVNGKFWRGAYMGTGVSQNKLFSNLPLYNMDPPPTLSGILNAGWQSLGMIGQQLNGGKEIKGIGDIWNAVKQLGNNLMTMFTGGLLNSLGRPQRQAVNSLLNDSPTGLWHLTIGNPKHPIMSMGNMILTDVQIQHYGPLGLDDFPTGLKVEIKLKHAMPRDAMKIEQMYMMGDFRIYQPLGADANHMYENAQLLRGKNSPKKSNTTPMSITGGINLTIPPGLKDPIMTGFGKLKKGFQIGVDKTVALTSSALNNSAASLNEMAEKYKATAQRYKQKFGTDDVQNIRYATEEGYLGANGEDEKVLETKK